MYCCPQACSLVLCGVLGFQLIGEATYGYGIGQIAHLLLYGSNAVLDKVLPGPW
jgi:hypothetical protein